MNAGIYFKNNRQELSFSPDSSMLYCVGKATYLSTVQTQGGADAAAPGRTVGYMNYRVTNPQNDDRFMLAFDLPLNKNVGVFQEGAVRISPGVWEFRVYCGSVPDANGFDMIQTPLDIWIFAMIPIGGQPYTNYGICMYNQQGQLTVDLARPDILYVRDAIDTTFLLNSPYQTVAVQRPVIIGVPTIYNGVVDPTGGSGSLPNKWTGQRGVIRRTSSNVVQAFLVSANGYVYGDDAPEYSGLTEVPTSIFLFDGIDLP